MTAAQDRRRSPEVLTGGVVLLIGVLPVALFVWGNPEIVLGGADDVARGIEAEGSNRPYFTALVLHAFALACLAGGIAATGCRLGGPRRASARGLGVAAGGSTAVSAALLGVASAVPAAVNAQRWSADDPEAFDVVPTLDSLAFALAQVGYGALLSALILLTAALASARSVHPAWAGVPAVLAFVAFSAVVSGDGPSPALALIVQAVLGVAFVIAGAVGGPVEHVPSTPEGGTRPR